MISVPTLHYDSSLDTQSLRAALIWGQGMPECPKTASEPTYLSDLLARVRSVGKGFLHPDHKAAVRNILRFGSYKPSGRGKPSSEYLLASALEGNFPLVNGPVDVNNAISLEWGYPASIFDIKLCGTRLLLRRGMAGENYVFNASGQIIDLKDLLCVCRAGGTAWLPCGNPVKDSVATKTGESTRDVAAVLYAPASESRAELEAAAERFAALLSTECGAVQTGWTIP